MNPTRVSPMSRAAGATSQYHVDLLAATSIPVGGQIVLTFPTGFDLSTATSVAAASSFCNADLNGPMSNVPTIVAVERDNAAGAITVTTGGAATGAKVFLFAPAVGGQEATTTSGASGGVATFASLAAGEYMVGLKPASLGNIAFNSAPQPLTIGEANVTKNFALATAPD